MIACGVIGEVIAVIGEVIAGAIAMCGVIGEVIGEVIAPQK